MIRSLAAIVTCLAALCSVARAGGGSLDGDFCYVSYGGRFAANCGASPSLNYAGEQGTLSFTSGGAVSASFTSYIVCPDGSLAAAAGSGSGTYVLEPDGRVRVTWSGVTEDLYLRADQELLIRCGVRGSEASILIGTRPTTGADEGLLSGDYTLVLFHEYYTAGTAELESELGTAALNGTPGAGAFTLDTDWHFIGPGGTEDGTAMGSGPYAVDAQGKLTVGASSGAVLSDGELAFFLDPSAGELTLGLLLKRGASFAADDLDGTWHATLHGGEASAPGSSTLLESTYYVAGIAQGAWSVVGEGVEATGAGSSFSGDDSASGTCTFQTTDGALAFGGTGITGWISASTNLALFADVQTPDFVEIGLLVRREDAAPGVRSCFGVACPCGNDDSTAGCANSTGSGGLLSGSGTASVSADDLLLTATQLPPNNNGLFYMGSTLVNNPFLDGKQCALGTTWRFLCCIQGSGPGGTMTLGPGVAATSGGLITPGSLWHFHCWHRDVPGSPCGTGANLTNVYSVLFQP